MRKLFKLIETIVTEDGREFQKGFVFEAIEYEHKGIVYLAFNPYGDREIRINKGYALETKAR